MRLPHEKNDYERSVNDGTQCHQRLSADEFHYRAEQQRTSGIDHPEADHDVADPVDTQGAGDVRLERHKRIRFNFFYFAKENLFLFFFLSVHVKNLLIN